MRCIFSNETFKTGTPNETTPALRSASPFILNLESPRIRNLLQRLLIHEQLKHALVCPVPFHSCLFLSTPSDGSRVGGSRGRGRISEESDDVAVLDGKWEGSSNCPVGRVFERDDVKGIRFGSLRIGKCKCKEVSEKII